MTRLRLAIAIVLGFAACAAAASARAEGVTRKVMRTGLLSCGVVTEEDDYNKNDLHGGLDDLGREVCQAVGVAVLGPAAHVNIMALPVEAKALAALQHGAVDLVVGVTPNATDGVRYGVRYGLPVFYDSLGFLVHEGVGIATMRDLAGKLVCYVQGTDNELRLEAALKARGVAAGLFPWQEEGEMDAGLVTGHCGAIAADLSKLAEARAAFHAAAAAYVFLPERLSLDPVAPVVRDGDPRWANIVDWTISALVQAEASGVTRANVATRRGSGDITVERLLGEDFATAQALGLAHDWSARVIAAVGNYGEIYERTAGQASDLKLPRGLNALWTQGGLMHPLPMR